MEQPATKISGCSGHFSFALPDLLHPSPPNLCPGRLTCAGCINRLPCPLVAGQIRPTRGTCKRREEKERIIRAFLAGLSVQGLHGLAAISRYQTPQILWGKPLCTAALSQLTGPFTLAQDPV
jgi:hypothetical protein